MSLFNVAKHGRFQPIAILPLLVVVAAFVLSMLCIFAGHRPGYMEDYAVFTLNTSRIGENMLVDFDNKILSLNLSKIVNLKRSQPDVPQMTPSPTETTMITMAPRNAESLFGDLTSEAGSAASDVEDKYSSIKSAAGSKVTALESEAASAVDSTLLAAETSIVEAVNHAYEEIIESLELKDFYSIHMMTTCTGEYVYNNGTNITVGVSAPPSNNTHKHVDSCEEHSDLDVAVALVRVLYEIGIFFTGLALLLGIWGVIRFSRKAAILNALVTLPALLFLGLASAAVHGVALGAAHLINFAGEGLGIAGDAGQKFITLTWAATILLLVNVGLWTLLVFFGERINIRRQKKQSTKEIEMQSS